MPRNSSTCILKRNFSFSLNTLQQGLVFPPEMPFLGNFHLGNPKSITQLDATRPQITFLQGSCRGMMPRMDPLGKLWMKVMVTKTTLITRKYSSSTFFQPNVYFHQEDESFLTENTNFESWLWLLCDPRLNHCPPFIDEDGSLKLCLWLHSGSNHVCKGTESCYR